MYGRKVKSRRGAAAMLAMMFIALTATLAVAMFSMGSLGVQSSSNLADATTARATAESGLRWQAYRLLTMPRPIVSAGKITKSVATSEVWPGLKTNIKTDYSALTKTAEKGFYQEGNENLVIDGVTTSCPWITSKEIALDDTNARFRVKMWFIPRNDPKPQLLRVQSTGYSGPTGRRATRSVTMDFEITKKIKFAVVGKVPIQLGRNAIVEGPLGTTSLVTSGKPTPLLMLSDFKHLKPALKTKIDSFNDFLASKHAGYDNRISVNNASEYNAAVAAGYTDHNGDAYVDEYDLFLKEFDTNSDKRISTAEFINPSTGKAYDGELFKAIDALSAPMFNEDKNGNGSLDVGEDQNANGSLDVDPKRAGFEDGYIDNLDGYAKVRGQITLSATAASWQNDLNTREPGATIQDKMEGTIAPTDPNVSAVTFGKSNIFDLAPENFEQAALNFKAKTGTAAGTTKRVAGRIENTVLSASDVSYATPAVQITTVPAGVTAYKVGDIMTKADFDAYNVGKTTANKLVAANGTNNTIEKTPLGSTSWQATYKRPIFKNVAFKNVQIPKGMNALFDGCTFEGVTWVETEKNITNSSGSVQTSSGEGSNWAGRKVSGDDFNKDKILLSSGTPSSGQSITKGSQLGNNLRFNNCAFQGPLANNYATAYTHFANSMEFTGSTLFDNKVDQTATIVCPQTNIEMGSFTNPGSAPSTLVGVVVAGNIDIRGTSVVDGSVIITGDGAGNTTLAYFGASDGDTSATEMPEGGFGRLNIRYNDQRALPDGIMVPVDVMPFTDTYKEGTK